MSFENCPFSKGREPTKFEHDVLGQDVSYKCATVNCAIYDLSASKCSLLMMSLAIQGIYGLMELKQNPQPYQKKDWGIAERSTPTKPVAAPVQKEQPF